MTADSRRAELAHFLRAMRARLSPEDVGLPRHGTRRTPGLRRQEVAQLAAVSIDWYIRVEQGRAGTPSAAVLDAIAEALRLSPTERAHLHVLAGDERPQPRQPGSEPLPASLSHLLRGMPLIPAYVIDFRFDVHARNDAAAALFGEDFGSGPHRNAAVVLFEVKEVKDAQLDWRRIARETVGNLRANHARHRTDEQLNALIDRLRADPDFALWWEDRTVEERTHGVKRLANPVVGELTMCYDYLSVDGRPDLRLVTVTPADAASEQGIRSLVAHRTRQHVAGVPTIAA
ncbi:helix-turn-helix transcriptional regulator [Actinospica sp.]|uniref:helix-turn-helix transcriptional regulator n=1 Tax=Actinospica sp. TaxID=1872142 RepID=UPI002C08360F|nr:helix-turn-helix transcriptional regulator [Actinospica sp.]HWG24001.1 helix-turn-helix transcriptional regulator [Actinospica sp.]